MGIRADIERERVFFLSHLMLGPNLLVIHPESWHALCAELDPRGMMLEDEVRRRPAPYCGMVVCLSTEVSTFRCALCIDDRDSKKSDLHVDLLR
jgi:hypothetical protein